jgi:pSer/pThr/pTyr-binding forkhead associated (FHA) protein
MKVSLVVAQGVHVGKQIPVNTAEFLIGRDPHCQLRPASPAVSKQHCGIFLVDGKVIVRDYGSTNGTFINDEQIAGEREVKNGDYLKAGPLEFTFKIDIASAATAATPVPKQKPLSTPSTAKADEATPAGTSVKARPSTAAQVVPHGKTLPISEVPAADHPMFATAPVPASAAKPNEAADADSLAALLFGMDDGNERTAEASSVPDGSTVMELPAIDANTGKPVEKKVDKNAAANSADSSSIAANILKKYMQRPRT